ncbi:MAG: glycosyltransferase family A protein [Verrucomicrobiota bacterium]
MKVGIAIGIYNNGPYIAEAIQSLQAQTLTDWCAVVIDNGSKDNSIERAQKAIGDDARFTLIEKENDGPSGWRNRGYDELPDDCTYLHFLDGDDVLHPDFLKVMTDYLDAHKRVGLLVCNHELIDPSSAPLGAGSATRFAPGFLGLPRVLKDREYGTPFTSLFAATGQGPYAVFRRVSYAKGTGYEPSFWSHEDADIFCQLGVVADVHHLPGLLYKKRVHGQNLTHSPKADYGKFREKWDNYLSDDPAVNRMIENALRYYYGSHAPLRHLKVAALAVKYTVRDRKLETLRWAFACLFKGLCELTTKCELRAKLKARP